MKFVARLLDSELATFYRFVLGSLMHQDISDVLDFVQLLFCAFLLTG